MYTPAHFDWSDASQIRQLIAEHSLAMLIGQDSAGESFVSHLPLMALDDGNGGWWLGGANGASQSPLGLVAEAGLGGGRLDAASVPVIRPFDLLL
ncbi:MAG: FMN-binding negative transcriptional regulator [Burkholderiaceae bacterium]|nr:FMN-binding negative transcriptional regulator [Burkholderiaceae bacterium]